MTDEGAELAVSTLACELAGNGAAMAVAIFGPPWILGASSLECGEIACWINNVALFPSLCSRNLGT